MKKISTLLAIALFISASTFAQWNGNHQHDRNSHDNNGYNNDQYRIINFRTEEELIRDMNLSRSQERKVSRINEQFRQKAYYIQNDRYSSFQQKKWQLDRLEQQRRQDIMNVLGGFQRDRYNAWCARNNSNAAGTYGSNGRYGNGRW